MNVKWGYCKSTTYTGEISLMYEHVCICDQYLDRVAHFSSELI